MTESLLRAMVPAKGTEPLLVRAEIPRPSHSQVVVDIAAAAINFADLLMIDGSYQDTPPWPFTPGMEGAGTVIAAGPDATLPVGSRVAISAMGTMAQIGCFDEADCRIIPDSMDFRQAAGFQVAYGTSHLALTERAALKEGETLLVLGAAGGVGLTAVEIGAALGANVIAVARGEDRLRMAKKAGASHFLSSSEIDNIGHAVRDLGGADVIYDPVGGALAEAAFRSLRRGGRYLSIGFAAGRPPELKLNHVLVKNITIHGVYWGGYGALDNDILTRSMNAAFQLFEQGKLNPHIGATMPLSRLSEAYQALRDRTVTGKLIVTMKD
ncbi:NADPH:quinone oxidoreductase family protein [Paracoccus aerodenitrificans]|uniref:NADPH:quinone oxidoreductase family protein n=1 Tax=Paracoccus aerodenitrificans TaxID=3017781 RepID=UPI0022F07259|nr:NADPH:quinone oxidoreductase family protein [Paracoccus aerodenitrificans]WBU64457.1 NADPH:quinone oxidoreductase family protein [Paracoccus aerodenitrificans]